MKTTRNSVNKFNGNYNGGHLNLSEMGLASLKGYPSHILGDFYCHSNRLATLEGAPDKVVGGFFCHFNELASLEGAPQEIGGDFWCSNNRITSLKGSPREVGNGFYCHHNKLSSLEEAPEKAGGGFFCHFNGLTSLVGAPREIGGDFLCSYNKLNSLKDVHRAMRKIYGVFCASGNPLGSHVLGLLLIEGLKAVDLDNEAVKTILNKHLPSQGMKSLLLCQEELVEAGFEEFAQL